MYVYYKIKFRFHYTLLELSVDPLSPNIVLLIPHTCVSFAPPLHTCVSFAPTLLVPLRRRSTKAQSGATTATAAASGEAAAQLPEELLAEGSGEHSDLLASLSNSSSAHRELDQPEELETAQPSHRDSARSKGYFDSFVVVP